MRHIYRTATVDSATVRVLAVLASVDPRSVVIVLNGGRVRGLADTRIREVLANRGIAPLQPVESSR